MPYPKKYIDSVNSFDYKKELTYTRRDRDRGDKAEKINEEK